MQKERVVFIDYLRVIACLMVMLVHASEHFYIPPAEVQAQIGGNASGLAGPVSYLVNETNRFWVAFYDGFLCRSCVPLFMIASAFLLVPVTTSLTEFYRRRLTRVLPPTIFFMLLYTYLPLVLPEGLGGMNEEQFEANFHLPWNFPDNGGHLWFMFPLISIYLIMPVVSPWLERASKKDMMTFLSVFALSTFLPFLHRFANGGMTFSGARVINSEIFGECFWNGFSMLWYCSGYLGYVVMAYFIRHHIQWSTAKRLRVGIVCALTGAAFTGWSFWYAGAPGNVINTPQLEWAWEFCTPNVTLATFGIFLLFTCIPTHKVPALVTDISKRSFGMYLVHMFFLSAFAGYIIDPDLQNPLLPTWLAIPTVAVATYVCCYITIKVVSLLPGSKWLVG
ncbi:MAG: acyltransferase [Bacteroidaceae bacterium]|nr:acyltransferase [Bacteroidaceae bacterium]